MRASKLLVVLVAALVLAAGPAVAHDDHTVSVNQKDDGTVTVTVQNNTSAVAGANVNVSVTDTTKTYDGAGTYTTDEGGTVELPEPNKTVNVSVVATIDGVEHSTTAKLEPAEDGNGTDDAFGLMLTGWMENELNNSSDKPRGILVSNWVLENNPGNASGHAGGPENPGNGNGNGQANGQDNGQGNGEAKGHEKGD